LLEKVFPEPGINRVALNRVAFYKDGNPVVENAHHHHHRYRLMCSVVGKVGHNKNKKWKQLRKQEINDG